MTPRETFPADPDDAPCDRCGATVHLPHDPPTPCGRVLCPEHDPCCCPECLAAEPCPTCDGAGETFRADPTDPPYGYTAHPCDDCNQETT